MNYLKQIWFELRQRPLVTWVTVSGTALSLFLLMAVYMANSVGSVEMAPESHRSRIMKAPFIHIATPNGEYSGSMSPDMAARLYENIDGVERVAYTNSWSDGVMVSTDGSDNKTYVEKKVDSEFWKIFDYDFISGSPFTKNEVEAGVREVILSESVARELGNGADLTGRDILVDYLPHKVKGVVRDPHPLLRNTWAQIWIAWKEPVSERWSEEVGSTAAYLLLKEGTDPETVKKEVERRFEVYNTGVAAEGKSLFYHQSPFTAEELTLNFGSNNEPDARTAKMKRYLLYIILLLLPAINLSGMTRSRLRRRISEIGVRRAFGATRGRIISQLIGENFLLSLLGGLIGLALCVIFIAFFSNMFVNYVTAWDITEVQASARPTFSMLFRWDIFMIALLFCFLLNILSTGIPAWKATSENPAEAISGKNN